MPDKYSYKASKKKKTVRRNPQIAQPDSTEDEIEAELTPKNDIQPIIATRPATAARSVAAAKPAVNPGGGPGISRVADLGAELRRLVIISALILVVLVTASLVLK